MPRAMLILFLLGAQLVSWNASPLFLCLDRDGSVCVDLGRDSCACCRHHHDAQTAVNAASGPIQPACIDAPPCDCTHVQITVAWTAVTVTRLESRLVVDRGVSALVSESAASGVALAAPAACLLLGSASEFSSGIARRSAILRC